jgi:hypothetical protein
VILAFNIAFSERILMGTAAHLAIRRCCFIMKNPTYLPIAFHQETLFLFPWKVGAGEAAPDPNLPAAFHYPKF